MDRRIQEVRQRIARRTSTGNQVIGGNQNFTRSYICNTIQ